MATDEDLAEAAEKVISLLVEDDEGRMRAAAEELLELALTTDGDRRRTRLPQSHFVCELFEGIAVMINETLAAPTQLLEAVIDSFPWGWVPAAAARLAAKHLLTAIMNLSPDVLLLRSFALKFSLLACTLCPAPTQHPSLDETCGPTIGAAAREGAKQNPTAS